MSDRYLQRSDGMISRPMNDESRELVDYDQDGRESTGSGSIRSSSASIHGSSSAQNMKVQMMSKLKVFKDKSMKAINSGFNNMNIQNIKAAISNFNPGSLSSPTTEDSMSGNMSQDSGVEFPVFGVSLSDACTRSRSTTPSLQNVPAVVLRCVEYLDVRGLEEVGLYRLSGSTSEINALRKKFNAGSDVDLFDSPEDEPVPDPNAVACLLKSFFRELPESILTVKMAESFSHAFMSFNESDFDFPQFISPNDTHPITSNPKLLSSLSRLLSQLPDQHIATMSVLFHHLSRVAERHGINKMGLPNLQVVWCPTLQMGNALFVTLIVQARRLLPLPKVSHNASPTLSMDTVNGTGPPQMQTPVTQLLQTHRHILDPQQQLPESNQGIPVNIPKRNLQHSSPGRSSPSPHAQNQPAQTLHHQSSYSSLPERSPTLSAKSDMTSQSGTGSKLSTMELKQRLASPPVVPQRSSSNQIASVLKANSSTSPGKNLGNTPPVGFAKTPNLSTPSPLSETTTVHHEIHVTHSTLGHRKPLTHSSETPSKAAGDRQPLKESDTGSMRSMPSMLTAPLQTPFQVPTTSQPKKKAPPPPPPSSNQAKTSTAPRRNLTDPLAAAGGSSNGVADSGRLPHSAGAISSSGSTDVPTLSRTASDSAPGIISPRPVYSRSAQQQQSFTKDSQSSIRQKPQKLNSFPAAIPTDSFEQDESPTDSSSSSDNPFEQIYGRNLEDLSPNIPDSGDLIHRELLYTPPLAEAGMTIQKPFSLEPSRDTQSIPTKPQRQTQVLPPRPTPNALSSIQTRSGDSVPSKPPRSKDRVSPKEGPPSRQKF